MGSRGAGWCKLVGPVSSSFFFGFVLMIWHVYVGLLCWFDSILRKNLCCIMWSCSRDRHE